MEDVEQLKRLLTALDGLKEAIEKTTHILKSIDWPDDGNPGSKGYTSKNKSWDQMWEKDEEPEDNGYEHRR